MSKYVIFHELASDAEQMRGITEVWRVCDRDGQIVAAFFDGKVAAEWIIAMVNREVELSKLPEPAVPKLAIGA
jgi:hypothetical protein